MPQRQDDLNIVRAKRMELPIGDIAFPLVDSVDSDKHPPKLDDQNCYAQDAGRTSLGPIEDAPGSPDLDDIFNSGVDVYEEI